MNLLFIWEPCLSLSLTTLPRGATSHGLSSPTPSVWGVLVCLTKHFRCKSHLIITRVRAVAEMLWVKGALVRRARCPGAEGCEAGRELGVGRNEGWALEGTLRGLGGRRWEQTPVPAQSLCRS